MSRPKNILKAPNNQVKSCNLPLSMYVYVCTCTCIYMCRGVWAGPSHLSLCGSFFPTTVFPSIQRNVSHERPLLPRIIDKGI